MLIEIVNVTPIKSRSKHEQFHLISENDKFDHIRISLRVMKPNNFFFKSTRLLGDENIYDEDLCN